MRRISPLTATFAGLLLAGVCSAGRSAVQAPVPAKPLSTPPAAPAGNPDETQGLTIKPPPPSPAGQLALVDREGRPAGECPLKHTAVKAQISGFVARVEVEQQFENTAKGPVEAVYTFPLPDDAAVDDMTMKIGDRVIRGRIKQRDEARKIYEAAKAAGQSAALLDQERPNIFTQSVANLMPGQKIRIAISYVNLLKYDAGEYEFSFPMVVGPRYTPDGGYSAPGRRGDPSPSARVDPQPGAVSVVTDADKITPPITPPATRAGHDLSLQVELKAGFPVREIRSQLHEITVDKRAPEHLVVKLREQKTLPNQDFILKYRVDGDRIQTGVLAQAEGKGGYFTLILQPPSAPAPAEVAPKEMVFVIDQTGSQSGWPIQKSKETMRYCIENLNPGDTFQLIGFNTQVFPCFGQPVPVTESNIQQALRFLEPIEGRGGTDILKSVDYALKLPDDPARPRIICYMTDGYVGNDMQIIDYIRKNRGRARMFPFGIGNSVNRFLIDRMAAEGRGVPYYVTLNTPGVEAASKFHARVAKPLLLDVAVDWNGMPIDEVFPRQIPDVFSAGPIILKGRYTTPGRGEITVRGLLRGKPWSERVRVALPAAAGDGEALPVLWAREKIEDLQAQDWLGEQTGNPDPKIQDAIVGLALDFRLMSQHTSFVAVEERVVNVGGRQRRVDVPVEMPVGVSYDGIFGAEDESGARTRGMRLLGAAGGTAFGRASRFYQYSAGGALSATKKLPAPAQVFSPVPRGAAPGPTAAPAEKQSLPRIETPATSRPASDRPAVNKLAEREGQAKGQSSRNNDVPAAPKQERLAPVLHDLSRQLQAEGKNGTLDKPGLPEVRKGRVTLQLWLVDPPQDALRKLKALGFTSASELIPGRVVLGTVPVERLEKLLDLPFIRWIDVPKFLD